jgi:hypothetical protein
MKLNKQLALIPAFVFIVAGAFGQEIHYNYERGANFSAYKTYQWMEVPSGASKADVPAAQPKLDLPAPPANLPALPQGLPGGAPNFPAASSDVRSSGSQDQLIDQDIKRAVDEQLGQKGLTKVEKGGDLQVIYHTATHQEMSINLFGSGFGGAGYGGWSNGSVQGQTSTIPIGTLVVDLYDPARKQLIWRGDATKSIELKKDPDKNYKNLQKAMAKLFKNYPPQPNK